MTAALEDIKGGAVVRGIVPNEPVEVLTICGVFRFFAGFDTTAFFGRVGNDAGLLGA